MRLPLALPPSAAHSFDVLTVGLNSIDLLALVNPYPARNTKQGLKGFAQLPGGPAATAAVGVARLGWRAKYIGRFGDDAFGAEGRQSLLDEGIDIGDAIVIPGATSQFAVILVDEASGERTVLWHRHEGLTMTPEDVPAHAVTSARIVGVDCHEVPAVTSAAARARAAGIPTIIDVERVRPGMDTLLPHIDVVIAADGFPEAYTGETSTGAALDALQRSTGAAIVCVTLGGRGSLTRCERSEIRTPGFRVDVTDTTGAGDAFRAGFIGGWLRLGNGAALEDVLRYANAVAGLNCRMLGARSGLPGRETVEELLQPFPATSV